MKSIFTRAFAAVAVAALLVGIVPMTAAALDDSALQAADTGNALLAGEAGSGSIDSLQTQAENVIAAGTWGTCPWEIDSDGVLTVHPGVGKTQTSQSSTSPWNSYKTAIKAVEFVEEDGRKVTIPENGSLRCLFCGLQNVTSIDLKGLDTSSVKDMSFMFYGCSALTFLDVSSFDTSGVTIMGAMFYDCSALTSLDVSGFDTSSVTDMSFMFHACSALTSLDVTGFDTSSVSSMKSMFSDCFVLSSIDVSGFDTSSVTDMNFMFYDCLALTSLDLSAFDTSGVTIMGAMFHGCSALASLDVSSFDTSSVKDMSFMFYRCYGLVSIDLSNFDTSKVTNTDNMFGGENTDWALQRIVLGKKTTKLGSVPDNAVNGHSDWYSVSDGEWYSSATISATRLGIADVYTKDESVRSVSGANVALSASLFEYDGTAKEPAVSVTLGGTMLMPGVEYVVSYDDNVNVGTARVTIAGCGNCVGSVAGSFSITPAQLSGMTLQQYTYEYNGNQRNPEVTVTGVNGTTLREGVDYDLTIPEGRTETGSYAYTATGKGNYAGTKSATFTITAKITKVTLSKSVYTYDGNQKNPTVTVWGPNSKQLKEGVDYDLVVPWGRTDVGTYTYTAKGKGYCTGSASAYLFIDSGTLASLTLSPSSYVYDGREKNPNVIVKDATGKVLIEGFDYRLIVPWGRKDVGSYAYDAEGIGNYSGWVSADMNITPVKLASITLNQSSFIYDGKEKNPSIVVKGADGKVLEEGVDYDLEVPWGRTDAGTYTYIARGMGVYTGSVVGVMKIISYSGISKSTRLWGNSALDTMSAIVDAGKFPKGGVVVITTVDGYWDALTAAGLAGFFDAPVLMTDGKSLSPQTRAQIKKLAPKRVIACGGPAAVSERVLSQACAAAGGAESDRCMGQTATGTAVDIYKSFDSDEWASSAFVCTNAGYWDALAAAPISYAAHIPIFLTEGSSRISDETIQAMQEGGIDEVAIIGGPAAIDDSVIYRLESAGITVVGRLGGDSAIETSWFVALFGIELGASPDNLGVATVHGYWDALAGAALCGRMASTLVLVDGPSSSSIVAYMRSKADSISNLYIFGGTAAISKATENAAVDAAR